MHDVVFYLALLWLVGLFSACVIMVARAKSGLVRVLALDSLTLVLVALLIVYSVTTGTSYYLDAALVLALISFISVIATARYHSEEGVLAMRAIFYDAMVIVSLAVMTLGIIGIFRMPDVYTKLHAASKSVFLGIVLLSASATVVATEAMTYRVILIALLVIITTPISSHVIGHAAYLLQERMETPGAIDESHTLVPDDHHPDGPTWRL